MIDNAVNPAWFKRSKDGSIQRGSTSAAKIMRVAKYQHYVEISFLQIDAIDRKYVAGRVGFLKIFHRAPSDDFIKPEIT